MVICSIRTSSQSVVQRLVSFKMYALSILISVGSVAEPDDETIAAETLCAPKTFGGSLSLSSVCAALAWEDMWPKK